MRRTKYSNEFKVQVVKGSGNQKQSSRGKTLRACLQYATPMGKEYESGENGSGSVKFPLWKQKSCPRENDHKTAAGEKDLEIAILRDLVKKKNPHLLTKLK
ncbi:transposase [Paenibacillus larvae]|nr:transposase [Paenibacillus larvae]MDT2277488.1 transposase [Paenibacillus larvae]